MATKDNLFLKLSDRSEGTTTKVTVVGVGAVGMACAFSILTQGVSNELVLIDMAEDKAKGEMMDLQHGSLFMNNAIIDGSADYSLSAGSRVCIITAGVRQEEGESRLNLVQRNIDVMKHIVPPLAKYSPDSVIFVVSNPCDILTWVAWKLSGFPVHRVIGSGTNLDTSRFRYLLAKKFDVAPSSVHAYIIGEHGDSSVPVWSGVTIGGVSLRSINPDIGTEKDKENFSDIHKQVVDSAYEVIRLKGYTNWAIGVSVANVTNSLITNSHNIHCVSTLVKGLHGIDQEVYLSLPCIVGSNGVSDVVAQIFTTQEKAAFQQSASIIHEIQKDLF